MSQWDVARPAAPRRSGSGDLELRPGGGAKAEQCGVEGAGGGGEPSFLLPRRIQAPASPPPSLPRAASPLLPPPPPPPRGFSGVARGLLPPPLPATVPRLRPVPTTTALATARASTWSPASPARRRPPCAQRRRWWRARAIRRRRAACGHGTERDDTPMALAVEESRPGAGRRRFGVWPFAPPVEDPATAPPVAGRQRPRRPSRGARDRAAHRASAWRSGPRCPSRRGPRPRRPSSERPCGARDRAGRRRTLVRESATPPASARID